MAGPNPATFAADPIPQATADPIYQAAMAASTGMSGAPGALPTHEEPLTAPPPPQGEPVMEMIQQLHGAPVMEMVPSMTALQTLQAEDTMGPPMTATQLLQVVEMIARLPLPTATTDFFDMPSGQQMTCQQEIAGFNESMELPYGPYIHNEMPSMDSHERSLPPNASNTLYVEGVPSNCTRWELIYIFRPFTGFRGVNLITRVFPNRRVVAFVEFNTPAQAFSAMESLQGYLFRHKCLTLQFASSLLLSPHEREWTA